MKRYIQAPYFLPALVSVIIGVGVILSARTCWEGGKPIRFMLMDDAMISMAFARSLAEGCGLVWYCGAAKVEGYTNLGWVLYMALWHLWEIPPEYASLPILLTGLFTLAWHIKGIYQIGLFLNEQTARIAAWMAAIFPPLIFHHTSGLEAGFLATLLTYYLYQSLSPSSSIKQRISIALIGTFTRMDFVLWIIAVSSMRALTLQLQRSTAQVRAKEIRALWLPVLIALLTAASITFWRKIYYGLWLPNTYTLKVTAVPFGWRILNGLASTLVHIRHNIPVWTLAAIGLWRQRFSSEVWVIGSLMAISIAYNICVGGDIYEIVLNSNRFLLSGFASLFLMAAIGLTQISQLRVLHTIAILLVSYGSPAPLFLGIGGRCGELFRYSSCYWKPADKFFPPGSRLLTEAAGVPVYFLRNYRWIDFLGKVDTITARRGYSIACYAAFPPYFYMPGHTRLDTAHLWNADGIIGGFIIPPDLCTELATPPPVEHRWWHSVFRAITPCKEGRLPPWAPFPDSAFRNRFCATYEPIPAFPGAWRRKAHPLR